MDKSIMNLILLAIFLIQISCHFNEQEEKFIFTVDNPAKEKKNTIQLKKICAMQEMVVLENSLNDTCMIGIMKIPPGKTGKLYRTEFFADSISYSYYPYRAFKGRLIIQHKFY